MGKFVTFEGGEGAGKSTLIESIKAYFDKSNIQYLATREPGGVKVCEDIRNILKYSTQKINDRAELLLFSASRAELVDEVILPNLKQGKVVLCDRFFDSTRAYQGYANGLGDEYVMNITNFATSGLVPDITFLLDIDPVLAFKRKGGSDKGDRIEARTLQYHQKVREGYLQLAKNEKRFVVLDATRSVDELCEKTIEKLKEAKII